ncbi:MAG TPA: hypothetical protein VI794_02320 [Patescibacteria group bacterium]|nr:hypothetical protein [Patescibacteria group bacterium]
MAISQSISSFFLPSQRRRRSSAGGGGAPLDVATQRVVEGLDQALEPLNAPEQLTTLLLDDLKDVFTVEATPSAKYAPGSPPPTLKVNLIDLALDPARTTWEVVKAPLDPKLTDVEKLSEKAGEGVTEAIEETAWNYLFGSVWGGAVPDSTRAAIGRWNARKGNEILRKGASKGIRANPGVALMMAKSLQPHLPDLKINGIHINVLVSEASDAENKISEALGNSKWYDADKAHESWDKARGNHQKELIAVYEKALKDPVMGPILARTPEAQAWRFWKSRDLYQNTLNFLRTYRKDGVWGVAKVYGWKALTAVPKKYLQSGIQAVANKLGVRYLLDRVGGLGTLTRKLKATYWVKRATKEAAKWLIKKLGLGELIGGLLGTAGGGPIGTAVGAVIGAVVQFLGEGIISKLGGVLRVAGVGLLLGLSLFVGMFVATTVFMGMVVTAIFNPDVGAPSAGIDCNQSSTATSSCVLPKATVKSVANRWGPNFKPDENHVNECYNDVIARSKAAGVDPRVVMAIWLHESNASNYEYYSRIGQSSRDFGIPAQAGNGFSAQITSFINFYKQSRTTYAACYQGQSDAVGLFQAFCTAGREATDGTCPNLTEKGKKCVSSYTFAYSTVNAGGQCN